MRRKIAIIASVVFIITACAGGKQPVDFVDPFIGTGGHGHTYPGATVPFGAVQLSPDNFRGVWDACSGYHYDRDSIIGFSHTHLSGTGCADLADILFHPTTRPAVLDKAEDSDIFEHYPYSHKRETATPGYYSVFLEDENIEAELTATAHTGWHRYTYPSGAVNSIIIDLRHQITDENILESDIRQTAPNEISGMRVTNAWVEDQHIYFVARFSKDIKDVQYIDNHKTAASAEDCLSQNKQAVVTFESDGTPLVAKVGLSIVSVENAEANLEAETSAFDFDFDSVRENARAKWNEALSKIKVSGGSRKSERIFYTALYHTAVTPNITSDVNGDFRRNNSLTGEKASWGASYSTLSLWDTFRSWLPLSTLVYPELLHDVVFSCMDMYDAQGELPLWPLSSGETKCMIGYHSIPFIVDAYVNGLVPDLDSEKALEAMVKSSNINEKGSEYYVKLGFIPSEKSRESVSCVLEYAYDDWAIARFADLTGKDDIRDEYLQRAKNYINLFDGQTGFFRGRKSDGLWVEPFPRFENTRDYTEATPWQYRFFTPQDFKGLSCLFGGDDKLEKALDETFSTESDVESGVSDISGLIGQYAHGNEPSHHIAYVYNYIGKPWKTQKLTSRIMSEMYDDKPDGLCGNEDCGQMSAWYVMTSLGLYDVCPGAGQFNLTSPAFKKIVISLPNKKTLTIKSDVSKEKKYIKSVSFNGNPVNDNYISCNEIMEGGVLEYKLSKEPDLQRGTSLEARPFSLSDKPFVSMPFYDTDAQDLSLFIDSVRVSLGCLTEGAVIRYTLDGSDPDENSETYNSPLSFRDDGMIKARAFKEGFEPSALLFVNLTKAREVKPSAEGTHTANGVTYSYFTGSFSKTTEIESKGGFVKKGILAGPDLSPADKEDGYGFIYSGFIFIPEKGMWRFATDSDDGSVLSIGGCLVVDNDGSHSASRQVGMVLLDKGYYPFTLSYFEDCEGEELQWLWQSPSASALSVIPNDVLFVN